MQKVIIFDLDGTVIDSICDITDSMNKMLVNHGFKKISIEKLIPEGKKEMSAGDFIRGRRITETDRFE